MTHKTKIIFILSIIYLAGALAAFVIVNITVDQMGEKLKSNVKVIADRFAQEKKYDELNELIVSTTQERENLTKYVLSEDDAVTFLADIERVGAEQGVEFETNSLQVVEHPNAKDYLEVKFSMTGSEVLVMRMLNILESLPYDSELAYLNLIRTDEETKLSVTLNVTLF